MREWESILRMRNSLQKIKDVHGNEIYTDGQMFSYLRQFEMAFQNSRARVIDATEGGAAKQYTTVHDRWPTRSRSSRRAPLPAMPDTAAGRHARRARARRRARGSPRRFART